MAAGRRDWITRARRSHGVPPDCGERVPNPVRTLRPRCEYRRGAALAAALALPTAAHVLAAAAATVAALATTAHALATAALVLAVAATTVANPVAVSATAYAAAAAAFAFAALAAAAHAAVAVNAAGGPAVYAPVALRRRLRRAAVHRRPCAPRRRNQQRVVLQSPRPSHRHLRRRSQGGVREPLR